MVPTSLVNLERISPVLLLEKKLKERLSRCRKRLIRNCAIIFLSHQGKHIALADGEDALQKEKNHQNINGCSERRNIMLDHDEVHQAANFPKNGKGDD